jgi:hypothetical protein
MSENLKIIQYSINNESPLLIHYVNYNGEMTERIVRNVDFSINKLSNEEIQEFNYDKGYITGFCELRSENRTFKIDRIQSAFIVNMKNDADKIYAIADFLFSISNSDESYVETLINNQIEIKRIPNIYANISLIDYDLYKFELFDKINYLSVMLKKEFLLNFFERFYLLDEKLKLKFNLLKIKK